jgi:hypothetical protein
MSFSRRLAGKVDVMKFIRSISVRPIAITVVGPKLPNQNRGE